MSRVRPHGWNYNCWVRPLSDKSGITVGDAMTRRVFMWKFPGTSSPERVPDYRDWRFSQIRSRDQRLSGFLLTVGQSSQPTGGFLWGAENYAFCWTIDLHNYWQLIRYTYLLCQSFINLTLLSTPSTRLAPSVLSTTSLPLSNQKCPTLKLILAAGDAREAWQMTDYDDNQNKEYKEPMHSIGQGNNAVMAYYA